MPVGITVKIATNFSAASRVGYFFVAYTLRGQTIRIISARKANRREVHDYENAAR
jgi:uncharacterized DUF497 family protein